MKQKLILLLALTYLVSCSPTTQLRKSWSDPSLAENPVEPFNKVFVMVNTKKEENKRAAEDQIISMFKKGKAVQSYTYVSPSDTSQKELIEKLIKDGFDGAVTMRLKGVVQTQTKTTTSPGTSYESWYSGPYGYAHSYTYSFDNAQRNSTGNVDVNSPKDYIIETNIYSLETKKLLWSGVTASMSAKKVDRAMTGIVNKIRSELDKKGFLKD